MTFAHVAACVIGGGTLLSDTSGVGSDKKLSVLRFITAHFRSGRKRGYREIKVIMLLIVVCRVVWIRNK